MNIFIDTDSPIAVYKQIKNQIKGLILQNEIEEGTRLPSIRTLAEFLQVANNTVARAYYELEKEHFLKLDGRRGSIVRKPDTMDMTERDKFLDNLCEEFLLRSKEYVFDIDEIIEKIKKKYNEVY